MGAPWSVTDQGIAAWVTPELALLREAHGSGVRSSGSLRRPLLAAALGGSVARAPASIGWLEVETHDPGLVPPGPWFQWHQDRWTAPPGARELARTAAAPQAFTLARSMAVQFHPELTATQLEGWLANGEDGGSQRMARTATGRSPNPTEERAARSRTRRLIGAFLDHVAAAPST